MPRAGQKLTEKELEVLKKQGFQKGHGATFTGKKMEHKQFIKAYELYTIDRKINQDDFAKLVGVSTPTLKKRLREFFEDGIIDGKYFVENIPIKSDWYDLKQEQYDRVREAYRAKADRENRAIIKLIIKKLTAAWNAAKNSQRDEVAEGIFFSVRVCQEVLYSDGSTDQDSDSEQCGDNSEEPAQGE